MNRLVLASLNQGARLVGVLERRCRDRLLQRTDVQMAAAARAAGWFEIPDGPYGPHDYGLTDFEEENESHEPLWSPAEEGRSIPYHPVQEMPDEVWPRTHVSVNCTDGCTGDMGDAIRDAKWNTVTGLRVHHRDRVWRDFYGDDWKFINGSWRYWYVNGQEWIDSRAAEDAGRDKAYGPFTEVPHSSATRPPVAAGASPGGATHPAPPGERDESAAFDVADHPPWCCGGGGNGNMTAGILPVHEWNCRVLKEHSAAAVPVAAEAAPAPAVERSPAEAASPVSAGHSISGDAEEALWDLVDKWRRIASDKAIPMAWLNANPQIAARQAFNSAAEDLSDLILDREDAAALYPMQPQEKP